MSDETKIEWTDATWNPVRGCSRVSEGCRNCYAEAVAHRFSGPGQPYEGLVTVNARGERLRQWNGEIELVEKHLLDPLDWGKPRRVFVNSMSDLFHPGVPDEWIDKVFAVMALAQRHTFQILTKRPERMLRYLGDKTNPIGDVRRAARKLGYGLELGHSTLPNVWLGVSVEDQESADERIRLLLQTPAAVRFISAEPLLGPLDLSSPLACCWNRDIRGGIPAPRLDWVIVGGESGPGARPCDVDWVGDIVRECFRTVTPCFVKQLGARPVDTRYGACSGCTDPDPFGATHCERTTQHPKPLALRDRKGGDPEEWPEELRVRQFPAAAAGP